MSRIFINYRREDAGGYAGRLYDRLSEIFKKDEIFMDVDTLEPGADFVERIEAAVGSADAFVAIIGRGWLTAKDQAGSRRLDSTDDFVRVELAAALQRGIRVIPVLVGGATMPSVDELPSELTGIVRRQALGLDDGHWNSDVERLAKALRTALKEGRTSPATRPARSRYALARAGTRLRLLAGVALLGAGAALAFFLLVGRDDGGGARPQAAARSALGPGRVRVPSVLGMTLADAGRRLKRDGFRLRRVIPKTSRPTDHVSKQLPTALALVTKGSAIDLVVKPLEFDWQIVTRSYMAPFEDGPPSARILGKRKELWAYFIFASALPPSAKIRVEWFGPEGRPVGRVSKPRRTVVESFARSRDFLAAGIWRSVLSINGKPVAEAVVRLG